MLSLPLVLGCVWVLAATLTALLPMRRQMLPGLVLLALAPVLLVWIGIEHGMWWTVAGLLAFASMFRNPLIALARRALGLPVEVPPEILREMSPRLRWMLSRELRDKLAEEEARG
jgi:hypothetical protein